MLSKHQSDIARDSGMMFEKFLYKTKSLYLQIQWKVKTWIPLVSKFLPNDTVTIYKKGPRLRIDTGMNSSGNVVKFGGHISLLFNPEKYGRGKTVIMDRVNCIYKEELFDGITTGDDLDMKVEKLINNPVESVDLVTDGLEFASVIKRGKLKYEQVNWLKYLLPAKMKHLICLATFL